MQFLGDQHHTFMVCLKILQKITSRFEVQLVAATVTSKCEPAFLRTLLSCAHVIKILGMSPWDKGKIIFSKITMILLEDCWSNHGVSWFHEVLQQSSSTISPKAALGMACLGSTAQLRRPRCSAWKDTENSWSNRECSKHRNIFVERLWEGFFCPQAKKHHMNSYDISI